MQLKEWAIVFLKHKDMFTGRIKDIAEKDGKTIIDYKDKRIELLIAPVLENSIKDIKDRMILVTENRKANLDCLIQNWHNLIGYPDLTIYFVNLDSSKEKKWVLKPYLHDKIADDENLKSGLVTLFESVDAVHA